MHTDNAVNVWLALLSVSVDLTCPISITCIYHNWLDVNNFFVLCGITSLYLLNLAEMLQQKS